MRFSEPIIQTYPYPLAIAAKRFNDSTENVERFMSMANLIEVTIKFLATIALVEYLRDEEIDDELQKKLKKLRRPSLGTWNTLLAASIRFYLDKPDYPFTMIELRDFYKKREKPSNENEELILEGFQFIADYLNQNTRAKWEKISLQNILELLVTYRNNTWGHGIQKLNVDICAEHTEKLQPALQALLEQLSFLANYPLCYVHQVKKQKGEEIHTIFGYMGVSPGKQDPYIGPYRLENRLYLSNSEDELPLSLHPMCIIRNHVFYILEYNDKNNEVTYSNCETGEAYEPENLRSYLISRLADDKQNKLEDIEIPVPPEDPPGTLPIPVPPLADILNRLAEDAREALAISLGESARIGLFWLGLEFLLMGLSKQKQGLMAQWLVKAQIPAGDMRGLLRGFVPIQNKNWRDQTDVGALGEKLISELQEIDPLSLAAQVIKKESPSATVSPRMMNVLQEASYLAGLEKINSGHLFVAALQHPRCTAINLFLEMTMAAGQYPRALLNWVQRQIDDQLPVDADVDDQLPHMPPIDKRGAPRQGADVGGEALNQIGRNLTALAQQGELRPAIGKSAHKVMVDVGLILQQTQANNPILLGDAGVGKTAIVEGLAWRIARGAEHDQPVAEKLAEWQIIEISASTLRAGTKYRGDLEEKLEQIMAEVQQADRKVVVFIDEIHTILSGKSEGGLGAIADALKPALARGEFPCIGATTVSEYRRYIESDAALARRFTPVWLEEPSLEEAIEIATQVAQTHLAASHNVMYPDETIVEAVNLAARYLHDEFLPGKAIKLLDQAGPRVVMGGSLRGQGYGEADIPSISTVTIETVQEIVSDRTGIPLTRLGQDDSQRLLQLEAQLQQRVMGQAEAIAQVARTVKQARTGLSDPSKPLGVFLFAGPTGVGKTELALALTAFLFDEDSAILRLDMSEFMEKHNVSRLMGAPPGYVGYEGEGQLTGHLRRRPYSVVLLDEIEKAHPDVQNLFLQLFDTGQLTDARGRKADGRNSIFIMTTNLGAKEAMDFVKMRQSYRGKLEDAIEKFFSAEFLGRLDRIIYFEPLSEETLLIIFDKQFAQTAKRFEARDIQIQVAPALKQKLCREHTNVKRGARDLQRAIDDEIVALLSDKILAGELQAGKAYQVGLAEIIEIERTGPAQDKNQAKPVQVQKERSPEPVQKPGGGIGLDPKEMENRALIQPLLNELIEQLAAEHIHVVMSEGAWEWFCSPFMAPDEVKADVVAAFQRWAVAPLQQKVDEGVFVNGDTIEISRNIRFEIDFDKVEGGAA